MDRQTRHLRFDIELLTTRLVDAATWLTHIDATRHLESGISARVREVEQRS
jgi:hypothetical protein